MPMDLSLYPKNWATIAYSVKEAAGWQCQECGRDCVKPGENPLNFAKRVLHTVQPEIGFVGMRSLGELFAHPQKWVLNACHLDQNPANNEPANLRAMCCPCHLKFDSSSQQRTVRDRVKLERQGQLLLPS